MSVRSKLKAAGTIISKEGPFVLTKKTFRQFVLPFIYLPVCYLAVQKAKNEGRDVRELIDFTFDTCGGYLAPMQIKSELTSFLEFVRDQKPQVVMEIGTARGGSLFLLAQMAPKDALIISLDIPGGKLGGYPSWKIPLYRSFASGRQKIVTVKADSHDEKTVGKIRNILGGRAIDLLFIDADHTYQGVKRDFDLYSPLVKKGGAVAFHDVATKIPATPKSEVDIFWTELKDRYENKAFVEDWRQGWAGIGFVIMK